MYSYTVDIALFYVIISLFPSIKVVNQQELQYCGVSTSPETSSTSALIQHNMESTTADCTNMGNKLAASSKQSSQKTKTASEKLKEYGYHFIQYKGARRMMSINDNDKGFEFDVHDGNRDLNQQRYEAIGEIITDLVYESLEHDLKLEKVTIPENAKSKDPKGFFFKSSDAVDADKLLILIHGSGVVRAGQWARSLIINDSWESGTMEPYIIQAQKEGFGIIITNGNHNFDPEKMEKIKGSENPQDHCVYLWKHFIKDAKAKDIVIVAHSFGGVVVHHLVRNVPESMQRIKAVAFTDSVHCLGNNEKKTIKQWFKTTTRNWISSQRPLDEPITYGRGTDCQLVSAGTLEHVRTSDVAKDSVFKFIHDKLHEASGKTKTTDDKSKQAEKRVDDSPENIETPGTAPAASGNNDDNTQEAIAVKDEVCEEKTQRDFNNENEKKHGHDTIENTMHPNDNSEVVMKDDDSKPVSNTNTSGEMMKNEEDREKSENVVSESDQELVTEI